MRARGVPPVRLGACVMTPVEELEAQIAWEKEQLLAAKIGPHFGLRRYPRIRRVAGHRPWWLTVSKGFRTERAARRWIRAHPRLMGPDRTTIGVFQEHRRWYAAILARDSAVFLATRRRKVRPDGLGKK